METILAGLLIAQGFSLEFDPSVAAQNPALGYRLGAMMGSYICHYLPYGRTIEVTAWMATEHYLDNDDYLAPGLFAYITDLPDNHSTKKAYTNGMVDQFVRRCPQIEYAPDK